MSWSLIYIGTPENVSKALKENSEKLTDKSKEEYDLALPHMVGLVEQNYSGTYPLILKIEASGHGYNGANNCQVSILPMNGTLV